MNRKEQLEQQIQDLYRELGEIRDEENARNSAHLLGKCFRVTNNYSCPETDDDYWQLYSRVISIDGGALKVMTFQDDKQGRLSVEMETYVTQSLSHYTEISEKEFLVAWKAFTKKLCAVRVFPASVKTE